jgi:hypothetical protein
MDNMKFNINDCKMTGGDFTHSNQWFEMVVEHNGSFLVEDYFMTFDINGIEMVINYDISVEAHLIVDRGDYYNPPTTDVDISGHDIDIKGITINEYDLELTDGLVSVMKKLIGNNI